MPTVDFMLKAYKAKKLQISGKHVLEIGPKHGIDTRFIASLGPESITCVELESKRKIVEKWIDKVTPCPDVHFCELLRYQTDRRFDVILFCAVIYHNIEQIRMLRKLHSLGSPGATMVFESAAIRDDDYLANQCVIQVFWPKSYRAEQGNHIHLIPSIQACRAMLGMSAWDIIFEEIVNKSAQYRAICRRSDSAFEKYSGIDHRYSEDV